MLQAMTQQQKSETKPDPPKNVTTPPAVVQKAAEVVKAAEPARHKNATPAAQPALAKLVSPPVPPQHAI